MYRGTHRRWFRRHADNCLCQCHVKHQRVMDEIRHIPQAMSIYFGGGFSGPSFWHKCRDCRGIP